MSALKLLSAVLLLFLLCSCATEPARIAFAQLADVQFGFKDYDAEKQRYEQAIKIINGTAEADQLAFMVMCGDMVDTATPGSNRDFLRSTKILKIPYHLAPGNHDITAPPESLMLYHRSFGADYYAVDYERYLLIVVNTNLWKRNQARTIVMDQWLKKELEKAKAAEKHVIVAGHHPFFLTDVDEPEDRYFNLPPLKREEILNLFREYDVLLYLGGHTHTRLDLEWEGIRFLHPENTCANFDRRPYGFRIVELDERTVTDRFVPLTEE